MVPSSPLEARVVPSGEKAQQRISPLCPTSRQSSRPASSLSRTVLPPKPATRVPTSHNRVVSSPHPAARSLPSGENATVWEERGLSSCPNHQSGLLLEAGSGLQRRTLLFGLLEAISRRSGENVTASKTSFKI